MLLQRVNCYPSVKKRLSVSLRTQAVGFGKPETSGSVLVRKDELGTLGTPPLMRYNLSKENCIWRYICNTKTQIPLPVRNTTNFSEMGIIVVKSDV
jgi:hypothetical protein